MKTVKMVFTHGPVTQAEAANMRQYSYDSNEDLKVKEVYASPSYPKNLLQVFSVQPKDETIKVSYQIKELVIGTPPEVAVVNDNKVYITKQK